MTDELEQLLRNLKLHRMHAIFDEQLRAADKQQITYTDFVAGLLRAQWRDRQENALEWRIRRACLPERWALETFPFAKQPGVNRKQIRAFAELDFVAKRENLVLIGPTGVGKTGLACGILLKALQNGLRCQFIRAQDLFDEMYASLADRSTRRLVNRLARLDVLLIDEMGYANLKPEQANVFFKLMEERPVIRQYCFRRHILRPQRGRSGGEDRPIAGFPQFFRRLISVAEMDIAYQSPNEF
jgi:DNA replication protein DnaC